MAGRSRIDYMAQLNIFNDKAAAERLSPRARLVYYTLLDIDNKVHWQTPFISSSRYIGERSGLDRSTVSDCLHLLEKSGYIHYRPSKIRGHGSEFEIIPLCQPLRTEKDFVSVDASAITDIKDGFVSVDASAITDINKTKYIKDEKYTANVPFAENVRMTIDEYNKLKDRMGGDESAVKWCITKLDNYKGSKGKEHKSDYRAILNCVVSDYEKQHKSVLKQTQKHYTDF